MTSPVGSPMPSTRGGFSRWFRRVLWSNGWRRTSSVVGATVTAIGLFTGVVSVIPILTRDATGLSSLDASIGPLESGVREFALPIAAFDDSFPAGGPCGAEQLEWLEERADPLERRFLIDMRNVASEGSVLALTQLRVEGERTDADESAYRVVCDAAEAGGPIIRGARLDVGDSAASATFEGVRSGSSADMVPDIPVGWNLSPGETGKLALDLYASRAFDGEVAITVHSGRNQSEATLEGAAISLPALWKSGASFLNAGADGFECRELVRGEVVDCEMPPVP